MPDEPLIINPQQFDAKNAEAVLSEIREVLAKRGYLLQHRQDAMILVKVESESLMVGRAVAYVMQITPRLFEWKAIDWGGDFTKRPVS
jgi:hypothetical protein